MTASTSELQQAWELVSAIEPRAEVATGRIAEVHVAIARATTAQAAMTMLTSDERAEADAAMVTVLGRAAAIAIAAGDPVADDWLARAERTTRDDRLRERFTAGRRTPMRYRALSRLITSPPALGRANRARVAGGRACRGRRRASQGRRWT